MSDLAKTDFNFVAGVLDNNKDSMLQIVNSHIKDIGINGGNVIDEIIAIRKMIFMLEEVEKGIKDYAINELKNYDKEEDTRHNSTMKVVETGVKYDFSASSLWVNQKKRVDEEAAKLKDIETLLKSLKGVMHLTDDETGEMFECYPPSKSSTTSLRVTIK